MGGSRECHTGDAMVRLLQKLACFLGEILTQEEQEQHVVGS